MPKGRQVMTNKITTALISGLSLSLTIGVVQAGSQQFSFKAHELETSRGLEALYDRIEFKAKKSCTHIGTRGIYAKQFEKKCTADLINQFVDNIDDTRLNSHHASIIGDEENYAAR